MKWFRWYRGTASNPKLAMVAELATRDSECGDGNRVRGAVSLTDVIAVWAVMLEDAAHKEHWGICKKSPQFIATVLRWFPDEIKNIMDAMAELGMVERAGEWCKLLNWHEYQYTSDGDKTGAERQRRYYNKHKQKTDVSLTSRNVKLTAPNALASLPDTDTDTDTEKKNIRSVATRPPVNEKFEILKKVYPRREGSNPWPPARKLFEAALKKGATAEEIIEGAKTYAQRERANVGTPFIPQMVKWLRNESWKELESPAAAFRSNDITEYLS